MNIFYKCELESFISQHSTTFESTQCTEVTTEKASVSCGVKKCDVHVYTNKMYQQYSQIDTSLIPSNSDVMNVLFTAITSPTLQRKYCDPSPQIGAQLLLIYIILLLFYNKTINHKRQFQPQFQRKNVQNSHIWILRKYVNKIVTILQVRTMKFEILTSSLWNTKQYPKTHKNEIFSRTTEQVRP